MGNGVAVRSDKEGVTSDVTPLQGRPLKSVPKNEAPATKFVHEDACL